MATNWGELLAAQLEFYRGFDLRRRLEGLTDEECRSAPAEPSWTAYPGPRGDAPWRRDLPAPRIAA
jgi:hypothetical protein